MQSREYYRIYEVRESMNAKEIAELRRRFQPDKAAISRIYGCYVNSQKEIVSYIDESLGVMPQEEIEQYLGFLKKALSGTIGKNLIDIVFSNQQVMDSEEHRTLMALRDSGLSDAQQRNAFGLRSNSSAIFAGISGIFCVL